MDYRQTIFGRQSVSLPNFFVAENIVHYLRKFVATWNPPFSLSEPCTTLNVRFDNCTFGNNFGSIDHRIHAHNAPYFSV